MQDFEYLAPQSVEEVLSLLKSNGRATRILSGGTDLLVQLREGRRQAQRVVDIKHVPEANQLLVDPVDGLLLGAAVPCWRICAEPLVVGLYPGLIDAASLIGGIQIQGRASLGGNLCNASPAADSIPALIVHHAVCRIAGPAGIRELPVESFCTAPGQNALQSGEFLLSLKIPPPPPRFGARYLRFIPRNEMDIAVVGAGASLTLSEDGSRVEAACLTLGAVAPTPLLVAEAGDWLAGRAPSAENLLAAAQMAQAAARPISDMRGTADQRRHLSLVLARRALEGALQRARGIETSGNDHH
jgi:carbon-monoxide dehydrogenase medium subunit